MKKIKFYKGLLFEIVETLRTICLFMATESRKYGCNWKYTNHFASHFEVLGMYAEELRPNQKPKPYRGKRIENPWEVLNKNDR